MKTQIINDEISDTLLGEVFDKMTSAIIVLDKNGCIIRANDCAQEMFAQSLLGAKWSSVVKISFLANQGSQEHEATLYDGRKILVTTKPLSVGQLVVLTDVTITCKLKERISHMERLSSIGKMAASLAHQIRTPLSAAMLYASNLCNLTLDKVTRKGFGQKLVDRLEDLEKQVSDVLLFARAGDKIVEHVTIDEVIAKAKASSEGLLKRYNARLDIRINKHNLIVIANMSALSGSIANLIVNALEAGANHLFIDVSLKGEQIVIKIADNGKGMPKQLISKIFEPFFTTKSNGTGLGLAVVQSVVSAHQGRIGLVSEENKGTCFSINLPLLKVALHEEPRMVA